MKGKKKPPFKCAFCNKEEYKEHLVVVVTEKEGKDHFHVHGPIKNKDLIFKFIKKIAEEANIEIEIED